MQPSLTSESRVCTTAAHKSMRGNICMSCQIDYSTYERKNVART